MPRPGERALGLRARRRWSRPGRPCRRVHRPRSPCCTASCALPSTGCARPRRKIRSRGRRRRPRLLAQSSRAPCPWRPRLRRACLRTRRASTWACAAAGTGSRAHGRPRSCRCRMRARRMRRGCWCGYPRRRWSCQAGSAPVPARRHARSRAVRRRGRAGRSRALRNSPATGPPAFPPPPWHRAGCRPPARGGSVRNGRWWRASDPGVASPARALPARQRPAGW